mmetsp:Transcript_75771/g.133874  ORF Transcript_75771/g.133874 Transcript_75771/m.133874 type:complete len:82 (-) Transcript_75771:4696-4941(-)
MMPSSSLSRYSKIGLTGPKKTMPLACGAPFGEADFLVAIRIQCLPSGTEIWAESSVTEFYKFFDAQLHLLVNLIKHLPFIH